MVLVRKKPPNVSREPPREGGEFAVEQRCHDDGDLEGHTPRDTHDAHNLHDVVVGVKALAVLSAAK